MRYAHITPLNNLKLADKYNDMHLLLYHWAKQSERYVRFMKKSKVYKMLDNSFYELHQEIDYDELIWYARVMKCQEIIAPDVMYNYQKTKKLIEDFIPKVPKGMKIQGVICGNSLKELAQCYDWLCNNERIDVIGLSKHGCTVGKETSHYQARRTFLGVMWPTVKPIHMLGVNSFNDFFANILGKNIRSIDGKYLCKVANNNQKIDLATFVSRTKLKIIFEFFEAIKIEGL